ncbi:hypothetical protein [Kangiella sp. HZ709]|uniref:hypothetical protein n=1 Tax=Kangiella sp. HZ709 TaxID=2666328 RepID=UPI0012AF2858|nr:hypothetical protein [Kangiella sp. HZ709]MRX27284.1 hypothetical protein [Kangiella sp. HZ709]
MALVGPKRDLDIAASQIKNMRQTTSFDEFRESWENFLFRIERAWELTERQLKKRKGIEQWHKPYTHFRKKDPLLVFLKQARNSEMHSISPTVNKPLHMVLKDKTGRGLLINSISSKLECGTLIIDIDTPDLIPDVDVNIVPTDPTLVKIKNRGKWYNPPWSHLKKRIKDLHPVSIAELGLEFYSTYVKEAELWIENN